MYFIKMNHCSLKTFEEVTKVTEVRKVRKVALKKVTKGCVRLY